MRGRKWNEADLRAMAFALRDGVLLHWAERELRPILLVSVGAADEAGRA